MSDSLQPHGLQHATLLCPSLYPRVCSNSCPVSQWCHPTILSSVVTFSSCLLSFPASGSFPVSWLFALVGQSIGASASASALPMNIQGWFPLGLIAVQGDLKNLLQHNLKGSFLQHCLLYGPVLTSVHNYLKNCSFDYTDLCQQSDVSAFKLAF